jgi:hypothetical protein
VRRANLSFEERLLRGARRACASTCFVAIAFVTNTTRADDLTTSDTTSEDESESHSDPAPPERPPDRPMPDYDGLPEEGDDAGDVMLWTARVLTSPLYLVSEYVLRQPIGWGMTEIERHQVIARLRDFFTFGPNDNIAIFPTFFYEFGFQPNVGIYAVWNEFIFPENRISTQGGYGGDNWLSWSIMDRVEFDERLYLGTRFLARQRPDYVFGGIGYNATVLPRARFGAQRIDAFFFGTTRLWQSSDIEFDLMYRDIDFIDAGWNDEPSVGQRAATFDQGLPYGFVTGYEAVSAELRADFDTRTPYAPPEGGFQLAAHVGQHGAFGGLQTLDRWISWGGSTTLATGILGQHRVLGVSFDAHFITPFDDSNIPFTELIDLGGSHGLLPGYRPGHIQGLSAIGLMAHYSWPIWAFLDARLYFGTANAFGLYLEDFEFDRLRLTFGIAIFPRIEDVSLPFYFNFAFGTETFENDGHVNSFRLAVGARDVL